MASFWKLSSILFLSACLLILSAYTYLRIVKCACVRHVLVYRYTVATGVVMLEIVSRALRLNWLY